MDLIPFDISSVFIFAFVFFLCFVLLRRPKKQLPGPTGLPYIGRPLFLHSKTRRRYEVLLEATQKYGDIWAFQTGPYNIVSINGYDNINEIFVRRADEFSDRPTSFPALKRDLQEGKGVVFGSGHPWRVLRRFTLKALRDFGVGKTSIEEKIFEEIEAASKVFETLNGRPTDVRLLTSMMISNIIYGIVFGRRFSYDDPLFHNLLHNLDTMFKGGGLLTMVNFLPKFLVRIVKTSEIALENEKRAASDALKAHIYKEIKEHEESFHSENIRDFVDLYIDTAGSEKGASEDGFTHGNIFITILDLFLAGSETTSNTINWCILYLMEKPDVQQRCYQELQLVFGDKPMRWEDRGKCPYVEATLLEIQRVALIAPSTLPHTNSADATINGCTVPKGSLLFANIYSSHMDPKYWDEPEIFRPERFIGDDEEIKNIPAFIPFGIGPRMCMGDSLAKMEMFLIFTNLLQQFEFRRENESVSHDLRPLMDQATNSPKPYKVRVVKRE